MTLYLKESFKSLSSLKGIIVSPTPSSFHVFDGNPIAAEDTRHPDVAPFAIPFSLFPIQIPMLAQ